MNAPTVLGIDPGGRSTGLCLIHGRDVLAHETITHDTQHLLPVSRNYLRDVVERVNWMRRFNPLIDPVLAVEDVVRPNWHMNGRAAADPSALLATAAVLGAVLAIDSRGHTVLQVRPKGNGSRPLGAYPAELVSPGERRKPGWQLRIGSGQLRHARSAYDVALAGQEAIHA
ncbi:hypothetical protein [Prescottella equi]|uniref:hypothetical protein n=1 Tax=Rhodococcus hoagii TaxID=43767 RepID=UPI0007CD5B76|nr:hypothetical protein [Prescottella equi]